MVVESRFCSFGRRLLPESFRRARGSSPWTPVASDMEARTGSHVEDSQEHAEIGRTIFRPALPHVSAPSRSRMKKGRGRWPGPSEPDPSRPMYRLHRIMSTWRISSKAFLPLLRWSFAPCRLRWWAPCGQEGMRHRSWASWGSDPPRFRPRRSATCASCTTPCCTRRLHPPHSPARGAAAKIEGHHRASRDPTRHAT